MQHVGGPTRFHFYVIGWMVMTAVAVALRFTSLREADRDERWMLTCGYVLGTWISLMAVSAFERRRLAVTADLRGRGTFGYLRGWLKTGFVEYQFDDEDAAVSDKVRGAVREFSAVQRLQVFVIASYIFIIPLLLFS